MQKLLKIENLTKVYDEQTDFRGNLFKGRIFVFFNQIETCELPGK